MFVNMQNDSASKGKRILTGIIIQSRDNRFRQTVPKKRNYAVLSNQPAAFYIDVFSMTQLHCAAITLICHGIVKQG